jgi:restriction endonuclease S subunit
MSNPELRLDVKFWLGEGTELDYSMLGSDMPIQSLGDHLTRREEEATEPYPQNGAQVTYLGNVRQSPIGKSWKHMCIAYPGDLIVSRINCFRGSIATVPQGNPIGVSQETYVYFPTDPNKTNIVYIYLLLRHPLIRKELERLCTGASEERTRLDPKKLLTIKIPVPEKQKQDEIAQQYQATSSSIAIQETALKDKLDSFNKSILDGIGVKIGEIPNPTSFSIMVSDINESNQFRLDESFHRIRTIVMPKISEPELISLKEYVDIRDERAHPKERFAEEFPYVEIGGIDKDYGFIRDAKYVPVNEAPSRARMTLREGDIILSSVRPFLGQCAIVESERDGAVGTTGFLILAARKGINSQFISWLLRSEYVKWKMKMWCSGSTYPALVPIDIDRIMVPKLTATAIEQYVATIIPEWDQIETMRVHLENLTTDAATFIESKLLRPNI